MGISKRNASLGDAAVLLRWRNSPGARKFSQNSDLIEIDDHLEWLLERLERLKLEPFFVFVLDNKLVGMSRLDLEFESGNEFVISIIVDPNMHGKGIGTKILDMTCKTFFEIHPHHSIVAIVHQNNLVSQKLFVNAGFELKKQTGDLLRFEKNL